MQNENQELTFWKSHEKKRLKCIFVVMHRLPIISPLTFKINCQFLLRVTLTFSLYFTLSKFRRIQITVFSKKKSLKRWRLVMYTFVFRQKFVCIISLCMCVINIEMAGKYLPRNSEKEKNPTANQVSSAVRHFIHTCTNHCHFSVKLNR